MTFLKGLVVFAMLVLVLFGAVAAGSLADAVREANAPVYCWSQDAGVTGVMFAPTWEEQSFARLQSSVGVDPTILTDFYTIKVSARNAADDTWLSYWAWPYGVEQDKGVQCNRENPNTTYYNAALWTTGTWVWHCLGIALGLLSFVALGAAGLQVAGGLCDSHDWCGLVDMAVRLLGIIWPLGLVAGGLWTVCMAIYYIACGVLKAGSWAGEL